MVNSNFPSHVAVSKFDFWVENQWKLFFDIAQPLKKAKSNREGVIWYSPPSGWFKFNFDGSAKGNTGSTSCGGVLRDHNGRLVLVVVLPMGI